MLKPTEDSEYTYKIILIRNLYNTYTLESKVINLKTNTILSSKVGTAENERPLFINKFLFKQKLTKSKTI